MRTAAVFEIRRLGSGREPGAVGRHGRRRAGAQAAAQHFIFLHRRHGLAGYVGAVLLGGDGAESALSYAQHGAPGRRRCEVF